MAQEDVESILGQRKRKYGKRKKHKLKEMSEGDSKIAKIVKIIFFVLLAFIIIRGVILCVSLKCQENESEDKYNKLVAEKAELEKKVEYINTPEYIEQTARETLKMVMPGEMLFVFKDSDNEADNSQEGK